MLKSIKFKKTRKLSLPTKPRSKKAQKRQQKALKRQFKQQIQQLTASSDQSIWQNTIDGCKNFREKLNKINQLMYFKWTEILSHTDVGAYGAKTRQNGEKVLIPDEKGQIGAYQVKKIITMKAGLIGEIMIPVNGNSSNNIYINWTGTHNPGTILADLEIAAGEESYRKAEVLILRQINQAIKDFKQNGKGKQKANIVITGHSLGGALAQLQMHSLQRVICTNAMENKQLNVLDYKHFQLAEQSFKSDMHYYSDVSEQESIRDAITPDNIHSMTLGIWNSTGVLKSVSDNSNQLASIVKKTGVNQRAFFGMVAGDGVQKTGEATIFSDVDSSDVDISLVKIKNGLDSKSCKYLISSIGLGAGVGALYFLGGPVAASIAAGQVGMFSAAITSFLVGISSLLIGLAPDAIKLAYAHCSNHFIESAKSREGIDVFRNKNPEENNIIKKKLNNKLEVLNSKPIIGIKKGLYWMSNLVVAEGVSSDNAIEQSINLMHLGVKRAANAV